MSEEMIEKVARAICRANGEPEIEDNGFQQWCRYKPDARAALSAYNPNERLSRAESLLKQALEAIESARSEPLFIMRDAIRNYLEDHSALSPLPQGEEP